MHVLLVPVQTGLCVDVLATEFTRLLDVVHAHHVTSIRRVVSQKFSTDFTRVTFSVTVGDDVLTKACLKGKARHVTLFT